MRVGRAERAADFLRMGWAGMALRLRDVDAGDALADTAD